MAAQADPSAELCSCSLHLHCVDEISTQLPNPIARIAGETIRGLFNIWGSNNIRQGSVRCGWWESRHHYNAIRIAR